MKVRMIPHPQELGSQQSGIHRVVEAYGRLLPDFDVQVAGPADRDFDLKAVHAGAGEDADVAHTHGLYWTADYAAERWEWTVNAQVIENIRHARAVTVPSEWVGETFKRDLHLDPWVVQHGIEWEEWQHEFDHGGYALWNKNRQGDVCDPTPALNLARGFPDHQFLMTFTGGHQYDGNVQRLGLLAHEEMKRRVQRAAVYLATTKETFGIGTLEAMASGVPVLAFNHGGNADLIEHGVTGYLARPGYFEDLQEGFRYCLEHRATLGANAREAAKLWTWEAAVEKVAAVYRRVLKEEEAAVTVVIPTFRYADKIGRAIQSALDQDYDLLKAVVVVDDGSDDGGATERVVKEYMQRDRRVMFRQQENQGVAIARNTGIAAARFKYVACLDADDFLEPSFLRVCIRELEADRSLGVAYTRLRWVKPDGSEGISDWPGEWDYDEQVRRMNQIPTACVFRHEAWARTGGYRQRYAPKGAGAEDAEFWLRLGALGWGAKLATQDPLFVYSWQSGQVSGDREYREVDWAAWHPWVKDGQHPFASQASPPEGPSHQVRQYDEPTVSVVIPVGPGHELEVIDALDSLEAQTFRKWEAVVVFDTPPNTWDEQAMLDFERAYPFVTLATTYGNLGPGRARNIGAEMASAPFLVFLDADDWLYPDALERMLAAWRDQEAIIYTDYVGKVRGLEPDKLAHDLQTRIYQNDGKEAVIGYRSQDYDPDLAQAQPAATGRPYHWCLVTCLVPKHWHEDIGGFDEEMETWEDVDYHWRMARAGRCYVRVPEELVVYRFWTGDRRAAGLQSYRTLIEYLRTKYQEIEVKMCNCGANGADGRHNLRRSMEASLGRHTLRAANPTGGIKVADDDMVLSRYLSPNRGGHRVVGPSTRQDYGYRKGGDVFLVHRLDVAGQPHLFRPVEGRPGVRPKPEAPPPPPAAAEAEAAPEAVAALEAGELTDTGEAEAGPTFDLHALPGVTKPIASELEAAGIDSFDKLLDLGVDGLIDIKHIGAVKAEQIYEAAQRLQRVAAAG